MPFYYLRLIKDFFRSLVHMNLGPRRIRFFAWFVVLFPLIILSGWLGFLIDNIFYHRYMRQRVEKPLFIIGNYRSGTTLLHRLIALDEKQFTGMKAWEIYTAPSISIRKLLRGLSIVDSFFGNPLKSRLFAWEERNLKTIEKHPMGIMEHEEDEGLFLFIWAGIVRWFFYPYHFRGEDYHYFDTKVSRWRKQRFMKFYERCIKRHLYYRGEKRYLSKNPASSSKIRSILEKMPDAKFVYLVRNPFDTLPSNFDFFSFVWHYFGDFTQQYPYNALLLELTQHFYTYPLSTLAELSPEQYSIVTFEELIHNPVETVESIYTRLGYPMTKEFHTRLLEEAKRKNRHKSNRKITIDEIGVSRQYVQTHYADILKRFKFKPKAGKL
ncbi:MAG: sulfotransferase family protein [Spirochaetaceae bacterium]